MEFALKSFFFEDMSPSIGTPPRFIQPPSINDARLLIPSLTQNLNQKWDPLTLSESNFDSFSLNVNGRIHLDSLMCNEQLNFNDIFPSVDSTTFGTNSIRKKKEDLIISMLKTRLHFFRINTFS